MTQLVSMELDDEEAHDAIMPIPMDDKPQYPFGLMICITQDEAEKLGIGAEDAVVGGMFHFKAVAKITSVTASDRENSDGPTSRIEAQITAMGVSSADGSDDEPDADDAPSETPVRKTLKSLYKGM